MLERKHVQAPGEGRLPVILLYQVAHVQSKQYLITNHFRDAIFESS